MVEFRNLEYAVADAIATITVNRPEKMNALDSETLSELSAAFAGIALDPEVRGVIVTGKGEKAFVAGADIAELAELGPMEALELSRRGQAVFREIELSRKPVVAAVNGFALGGGCELALACHLRIASENARFGLPEVKLGIIPGYGGTLRLPRIIGKGRALEMILSGEMVNASEAYRMGLANRIVPSAALQEAARSMLLTILRNGPLAVALAVDSVTRGLEMEMEAGQTLESNLFAILAATGDMKEGIRAFLEKRAADFQGR